MPRPVAWDPGCWGPAGSAFRAKWRQPERLPFASEELYRSQQQRDPKKLSWEGHRAEETLLSLSGLCLRSGSLGSGLCLRSGSLGSGL